MKNILELTYSEVNSILFPALYDYLKKEKLYTIKTDKSASCYKILQFLGTHLTNSQIKENTDKVGFSINFNYELYQK